MMFIFPLAAMQPWSWLLILVVVLLLFGATKLPALSKSLGQSIKIFRKEMRDESKDSGSTAADEEPTASGTSTDKK